MCVWIPKRVCNAVGIGSGFCVEHSDGSPVNLVTLYRAIKAERQQTRESAKHINRLMMSPLCQNDGSGSQLISAVSELCRHADAFLLVIDASTGPSKRRPFCPLQSIILLTTTFRFRSGQLCSKCYAEVCSCAGSSPGSQCNRNRCSLLESNEGGRST